MVAILDISTMHGNCVSTRQCSRCPKAAVLQRFVVSTSLSWFALSNLDMTRASTYSNIAFEQCDSASNISINCNQYQSNSYYEASLSDGRIVVAKYGSVSLNGIESGDLGSIDVLILSKDRDTILAARRFPRMKARLGSMHRDGYSPDLRGISCHSDIILLETADYESDFYAHWRLLSLDGLDDVASFIPAQPQEGHRLSKTIYFKEYKTFVCVWDVVYFGETMKKRYRSVVMSTDFSGIAVYGHIFELDGPYRINIDGQETKWPKDRWPGPQLHQSNANEYTIDIEGSTRSYRLDRDAAGRVSIVELAGW